MNATLELFGRWKEAKGLTSDPVAAAVLGVAKQTVSNWRTRGSQAEAHLIAKMTRDLGEDPGKWLALVESQRARTDADRKTWAALARQLGAAAAVAFVALLPFGNARASAMGMSEAEQHAPIYIMRSYGYGALGDSTP